ncbi:MAG: serine/threonine protein kinase [Deltaproteobacteria bacterium]|nr:serine/threonine protein kinase [Deltaproteobacteria bacterium]
MDGAYCPECRSAVERGAEACGSCGTARPGTGWPDEDSSGKLVGGRYRIERRLAAGGFGTVFLATHVQDGVELGRVVLKFLHRELAASAKIRRRVINEVRVARALVNPHIVRVLDLDEDDDGVPFQVQEYVDGEGLDVLLRRAGPLPPGRAAELARQIAEGLAEAHAKDVVHRDLKPENIRIERATGLVKILDFGVARVMGPHGTATTSLIGTPRYMAPEQILGRQVDGRTDIWALGVLLFEMLTGRAPIPAEGTEMAYLSLNLSRTPRRVREILAGCPEELDELVFCMLAKEPERRPRDMAVVAAVLAGMADPSALRVAGLPGTVGAPAPFGLAPTMAAERAGVATAAATGVRAGPAVPVVDEDTLPTFGARRKRRLAAAAVAVAAIAVGATVGLWPPGGGGGGRAGGRPGVAVPPVPAGPVFSGGDDSGVAKPATVVPAPAPPLLPGVETSAGHAGMAADAAVSSAAGPDESDAGAPAILGPVPRDAGTAAAVRRDGRSGARDASAVPVSGSLDAVPAGPDAGEEPPAVAGADASGPSELPFEKIGTARRVQPD